MIRRSSDKQAQAKIFLYLWISHCIEVELEAFWYGSDIDFEVSYLVYLCFDLKLNCLRYWYHIICFKAEEKNIIFLNK